jgi:hypothetical protein
MKKLLAIMLTAMSLTAIAKENITLNRGYVLVNCFSLTTMVRRRGKKMLGASSPGSSGGIIIGVAGR